MHTNVTQVKTVKKLLKVEYLTRSLSTFKVTRQILTHKPVWCLSMCLSKTRNQEWWLFAKVKSVCVREECMCVCVCAGSTGYQMASCAASFPLLCSLQRAGTQGHGCVCPETKLLSWGSIRDKDPSSPGGCRVLQRPVRLSCS